MKRLIMVTSDDLRLVQGVNYVINSFVKAKDLFQKIEFTTIYGGNQTVHVDNGEQMPIGINVGTAKYTARRKIRVFLKKILSSNFFLFAWLKYQVNFERPAKRAIRRYVEDERIADFILFHDILTAYYFFTSCPRLITEKTAFIIHAADDNLGQLLDQLPSYSDKRKQLILKQRDFVYEHVDKLIYISKKACDNSIWQENKKEVIYNGIDNLEYDFSNTNKNSKINLVCVGGMSGWKGQELIIQALAIMPIEKLQHFHLFLVGDGAERSNLEKQVNDANLKKFVTFTGTRNDVADILRTQDVFVMPSKDEGLSVATLEGIRAGLFMLLTDAGGNKEVMGSEGGFIIERNAGDICEKLCMILDKRLITKEQKERSHQHFVELFTTESFISKYEKMFLSINK